MYLNKKFKKSKIFVKKCFKYHLGGASFKFIDTSLKNDKEVISSNKRPMDMHIGIYQKKINYEIILKLFLLQLNKYQVY